ncbi:MAG: LPS export ABC transporter periplasmic protein LptC [Flavobacteriales bacterium]
MAVNQTHWVALISCVALLSCKNEAERFAAYLEDDFPTIVVDGFTNRYIDSGRVTLIIKAPELVEYNNKKRKYREFPAGVQIEQLENDSVVGFLRADYAIMQLSDSGTLEANGHVLAVTRDEDSILTSRMVWDRAKKIFYSHAKTTILSQGSVLPGEGGFEAAEDMSSYRLLKPMNGKIKVKVNEETKD